MKLLSMLICLAMLLSGFAVAEEPAAAQSTVITVRDVVVNIQGTDYPLNPTAVLGVAAGSDSVLIDFGMPLDGDVLFPVQAKIDENGAAVLLGDSKTAYTFTPELFASLMDEMMIPEEVIGLVDSYAALISETIALQDVEPLETNEVINAKLAEMIGEPAATGVEFTLDGETLTGDQYVFELDAAELAEFMDYAFAQLPAGFTEAYFDYFNAMQSLTGGPEINSFSDIFAMSGMQMGLSGDLTVNDVSAVGSVVISATVDPAAMYAAETEAESIEVTEEAAEAEVTEEAAEPELTKEEEVSVGVIGGADGPTSVIVTGVSAEPVSFEIPMEITVYDAENAVCTVSTEYEGVQMDVTASVTDGAMYTAAAYTIPDAGMIAFDVSQAPLEDGSLETIMTMGADLTDSTFSMNAYSTATDAGSVTDVAISCDAETFTGGVTFTVEETTAAIEDRISAAEPKLINSVEEIEGSVGLIAAAVGLAGDAEPLLNDESVSALSAAVQEFFGLLMTPATEDYYYDDEYYYADENAYEDEYTYDVEEPAQDIPLTEPTISYIPEGYSIVESYYDAEYEIYSYTLLHESDEAYETALYINVFGGDYEPDPITYFSAVDGVSTAVDGTLVSVTGSIDEDFIYRNAYAYYENCNIDVTVYDMLLTDEELANIVAGVSFAE